MYNKDYVQILNFQYTVTKICIFLIVLVDCSAIYILIILFHTLTKYNISMKIYLKNDFSNDKNDNNRKLDTLFLRNTVL